ncbi:MULTISPECIES: SDR family NAD(P)-dependent oxidoreductase [Pseudomonas]|uniref:SDR family NAD(P)-dependent oxidoreductase n=1 Tax=Pseudomonas TaxID=286 RepID=UPI000D02F641|nr:MULTISPECIES: SDR family oxidoreductase [Pseudomonas]PRW85663.1 short-chain dehydrogenase [Pseudomonas simiae]CAH0144298.1 Dihydroanticapsin 7-dehydrogenase [Pseudomonas carnis]CAH0154310.1 Dihydroanticapsin 7-dehydrogenase [Pseudomonas carnis]CAH0214033.1 Dihydroanticapsin 7-dehydrogenase [Pseudomonas carnis]CAH0226988.1 Dihydroanticapsin 7-dehydrogenase [Pseudomonas carnis]
MSHTDHTPATPEQSEHHSAVFQHSAYSGIQDKVVVVTGGGSGIGLALAEGFARNGAHLLLIDINDQSMTGAKIMLQHRFPTTRIECFQASVTDEAAVDAAFSHAKACFGRIDVLLNNAGVSINKPSLDITPAEWRRAIEINFNSVFFCAQAAARYMIDQQAGVIINTSSMWGVSHSADRTAYCATKAAVVSMTKCLAVEWARHGIRMNAIGPGYTRTPLVDELQRAGRLDVEALRKRTPLQRLGEPGEMAELALFLASSSATFITGQIYVSDGGWTANGF